MSAIPTIVEAARLIAAKQLSPVELTKACLDWIIRLDGTLHAFIRVTQARAAAEAKAAEAHIAAGNARGKHPPIAA